MEKGKTHVLVVPYPAQGHINPMLQFSKRLFSKGVKTTLVITIFMSKTLQYSDPDFLIPIETISDGYDEGGFDQAESAEVYLTSLRVTGSQDLANLTEKYNDKGEPISAIIYDGFLPWALDVVKRYGLVGAAFFTQSCAVNSVYYHVQRGLLPVPLSGSTILLPTLPVLKVSETPSFVSAPSSYPAFLDMALSQFSDVDEADCVLFNNFYSMEKEVVDWMAKFWRVKTIGPTLPSMYLDKRLQADKAYSFNLLKPKTDACINWLNDKPNGSVVYVSFGSLAELSDEQTRELAWGLLDSKYYFLWVLRASGVAKLPEHFIEETLRKGLVVDWCPQLEVLSHNSIGCFVTHCGFNSVLEALSLGVPMVAMAQWTDQHTNAKYVEDVWGLGLRAPPSEKGLVGRVAVELCLREVMEGEKGEEIRKNALKWMKLAREAIDKGGSSDKNIDEFVAKLSETK